MKHPTRLPRTVTGLLLLAGLAGLAGCGQGPAQVAAAPAPRASFDQALFDRLPEPIQQSRVVRVGTDATYPPASSFAADGRTIEGFEPDLAAAVGRVLGVELAFVRMDFVDALPALERGDVELVMSAMTDTKERQQRVDFVDYFTAGTSILVQRGNPRGISDLRDLCGRRVAAEEATVQVDLLQRTQASCRDEPIEVAEFVDNATALVELRTGRADAVLNDYPPAAALSTDARTSADYQLASTVQYEPGFYGIAVHKEQTALRDAVQEALARVIRSGEYEQVLSRWGVASGAVPRATINGGAP